MASQKKLVVRCTGIGLLADGRQQVTMEKAAAAATSGNPGETTTVNSPDAMLQLTVAAEDSGNYGVGKDYTVTITS